MNLFIGLLAFVLCGGYFYQKFRGNISRFILRRDGDLEIFNYNILFRLFLLYSTIAFLPPLGLILFSACYDLKFFETDLQLVLIFIATITFALGIGTYQASTIIERFTARPIKDHDKYISLRLAIKFFHGPVSHVLIYAGVTFLLTSLTQYSKFNFSEYAYGVCIFVLLGFVLGIMTGKAQHINMCWFYQLPAFLFYLLITIMLILSESFVFKNEFTLFTLSWLIGTNLYLVRKFIRAWHRNEPNYYSPKMWRI